MPIELDPTFARVCFWLFFVALLAVAICLPLITFFIFRFLEDEANRRSNYTRRENRIADELEKLCTELKSIQQSRNL